MKTSEILPVNGIKLYYEIHGTGIPLLLLHGFTGSGADWEYIRNDLPSDFQFIIPDLRGHGHSTHTETYTHRQVAHDLLALLDHLDISQCKAIGVSGGSLALLHMATQQPDCIETMVLVSATHYYPQQARQLMALMTEEAQSQDEWAIMRQRHQQGDDQIRWLWNQGHAFKDSYDDVNFTPPFLSTITAQTLLIHGDQDPLYPTEIPLAMHSAISKSSLWVVPQGGHVPIFGQHQTHFIEAVSRFLKSGKI